MFGEKFIPNVPPEYPENEDTDPDIEALTTEFVKVQDTLKVEGSNALQEMADGFAIWDDEFFEQLPAPQREVVEKMVEHSSKFRRFLRQMVIGVGLLSALGVMEKAKKSIEHEKLIASIPKLVVTESEDEDGKKVYHHQDATTEHIIDYIAGKEEMNESDVLAYMQWRAAALAAAKSVEVPSDFFQYSKEKTKTFLEMRSSQLGWKEAALNIHTVEDLFRSWDMAVPKKNEYNERLYILLWEYEKNFGAPVVSWTVSIDQRTQGKEWENPVSYSVTENKILISPGEPLPNFVAELAHAKQASDDIVDFLARSEEQQDRAWWKWLFGMSEVQAQLEEYNVSGSLEHEAHQKNEPELKSEVEKAKKKLATIERVHKKKKKLKK